MRYCLNVGLYIQVYFRSHPRKKIKTRPLGKDIKNINWKFTFILHQYLTFTYLSVKPSVLKILKQDIINSGRQILETEQ